MSGGAVVNGDNELIGIHVHEDGFCVNWPRNSDRTTARGFRETVLTYFPDAQFAEPVRYTRTPETAPPPPPPPVEVVREEPKTKKVPDPPKEKTEKAGGILKAVVGGAKKAVDVVKVVAPVVEAVAPVAAETGLLALLGPYAAPVGVGLWAAREIVPRVAAWRRKKKAGQPVDGMAGYEHAEDGSVRKSVPDENYLDSKRRQGFEDKIEEQVRLRTPQPPTAQPVDVLGGLAKELATLVSRYEIQPNGKPEETFYKDAVRMVMQRHPEVDVLGGPEVGRNIIQQVAKMHAAANGDTLSGAIR
jgi:hypothetical protein